MDGESLRCGRWTPRHLEPVLDLDLVRACGVVRRELPAAAPELDPGKLVERALLPTARLARAARRTRARAARARRQGPSACMNTRPSASPRLVLQARLAGSGREFVRSRRVCRRVSVSDETAEEREHSECDDPHRVVVEIVGQLERGTCVLERSDEALLEARSPTRDGSGRSPAAPDARSPRAGLPRAARRHGRVPRTRRGGRAPRRGAGRSPISASRSLAIVFARVHSPAARCARAAASARRQRSLPRRPAASAGSACSASSAAIADAPRSAASPCRVVEHRGDARGQARHSTARGDARGGPGRRRSPRSVRERSPLLAQVAVENRRQQRMGEADRRRYRARSRARRLPGASASAATPARSRSDSDGVPSADGERERRRAWPREARRSSRERARRASREPEAARAGRCPHRERVPAPARRTDCRRTARGCGATSGARRTCRAGRAAADGARRR